MRLEISLETREFLERFFGNGNRFELKQIERQQGIATAFLVPWIMRLNDRLPTVLPYIGEADTNWYGLAFSEPQLRGLREDLTAFIGPTWSTFRGQRTRLNLSDPIEAAVFDITQGNAFKFRGSPTDKGNPTQLRNALSRMLLVLDRKPISTYEVARATGRVLRDFHMALRAGERPAAEKELQYLRSQNRLDTTNLLFLRVQMLAELQAWQEILQLYDLGELLQMRRPPAVTQALIQAVYQCELSRFERSNAARSAASFFHEAVLPEYGDLYANRAGSRLPEVVKSFMLLAVGGEKPNPTLRDELLTIPGLPEADQLYLQNLARLLPPTVPDKPSVVVDPLEAAIEAQQIGDYDRVIALLTNYSPSPQSVRLLLMAAYELQTLETERIALQALDQLTLQERELILASRSNQTFLNSLISKRTIPIETTADLVPTNWLDWLSILEQNPNWDRALYSAAQGAQEWSVADLLSASGAIDRFVSLQTDVASKAPETLQNAFPHFLSSFQKDPDFPRREFLPIYTALLENLTIGILLRGASEAHLAIFNELITLLLKLGVSARQYTDMVSHALDLWETNQAPSTIDWGLDLINIFVVYPCSNQDKRSQLLFKIAETLRGIASRVDEAQWSIFHSLAKDLGLEASFSDLLIKQDLGQASAQGEQNIFQKLRNKAILIYTLTEPVAQRVKSFLEEACEGITVHLSHDKGGSDRLCQWSRNDDLIVMVTASAKHAATGFIEEHCPQERLLRVNSKGSASLLREIQHHLELR
ncbi:protein DpdD [Leptolyngbya sp. GGD]|uniref:protein DpdD n=1 Tax=Leptolyngbya sp. GGD TaxID=2997907 RepID=UPI00227AD71F|nr:protein DpdD [Leptolyngbya sp. GGD]MCY6493407.1 protein DpdD [Leptolyngbya sp. GGD]